MKVSVSRRTFSALLWVIVVGTISCGDYSIRLPGGYSLVRVYSRALVVSHPDTGIVIEANVDNYAVIGSLIVGHVSLAERDPEKEFSRPAILF